MSSYVICPFCGGHHYWSTTEMANERIDEYDEDDTAMVNYYVCERCGRDFEIVDPPRKERLTTYKDYWRD